MTKMLRFTSAPVGVLLVLLTVITMVSGVTTLFSHSFPAIPTTSTMTTTCAYQAPSYPLLVSDPSVVQEHSSGQVSFACPGTNPAFTISGGVFSAIPLVYFGAPYTTWWIYQSDGATTTGACSGRTEARQIEYGVLEVDMAAHNYNYCAEYLDVGSSGLPSSDVVWYTAQSVFMFQHHAPAVPTPATMTSTCANGSLIANPSAVDPGTSGQITFQCSDINPAFTISGGTFSAIPYFTMGAPYTTLWIYQSDGTTTTGACSGRTEARQIEYGVTEVDMAAHNYDYCAEYLNVGGGGLPAFGLTWYAT